MAVVFPDDFLPEFAAVDPDVAAFWIGKAECAIDCARWAAAGCDCDEGVVLKASHLMSLVPGLIPPQIPTNSVTSESRGGKSVTRATGGGASGPHGSSPYGQALDNILTRVYGARRRVRPPRPAPVC
jgi:hypothetical protein